MDDPPVFTYRWLRRLVAIIREEGGALLGKPIRVGETFDPGPEFARSPFKYERHNEVCLGGTMGRASFVCCYGTLKGDRERYAGFPDGIPDGTPFGRFLGRQCRHFLHDLGFDYLWLSNGFGFGTETWALRGVAFDGERFQPDRCAEARESLLAFWRLFREECPDIPLEVRGTNLSTAMDLASDAVPLRDIYRGGFGLEPPPNSPWAALNADFGVELVGWMSHIAEIPGETFPYRFYTHDPWWLNSPWLDRYGREPHDIHLPLSVSRVAADGTVQTPTSLLFLTADDSYGRLPDQVPVEVAPHILAAWRDRPDQPGPLLWVYPFDEYHDWTFGPDQRLDEVFFGDWFVRGAVNHGLPLNTVISTRSLSAALPDDPTRYCESILVSPVPQADGDWERSLLAHVEAGGKAMLYGPLRGAGTDLLERLNLAVSEPVEGEFEVECALPEDQIRAGHPLRLAHHALLSAGGIESVLADPTDPATRVLLELRRPGAHRVGALARGGIVWVRGTVTCDPQRTQGHLLVPLDPRECFPAEAILRWALSVFGWELLVEKGDAVQRDPMLCVARHANGWFLSGHSPDTTVRQQLRFPAGAPLLLGLGTELQAGRATYGMPPAWHRECRVFVEQAADSRLACREQHSGTIGITRRLLVSGLREATVRFFHEPGSEGRVTMLANPRFPFVQGEFRPFAVRRDALGHYLQVDSISGELLISW
jgi:hypothetical protein